MMYGIIMMHLKKKKKKIQNKKGMMYGIIMMHL